MTSLSPAALGADAPAAAVGSLSRGLAVLRALSAAGGRRAVSELVRDTRLARSTVDRVVSTLAHVGYLRLDGRDAVLTPLLTELGNAYLGASRLPELLGPVADALADELDESVSLAVPDRDGVRFVHQAVRRRAMSLTLRIGDLLPAERGAPGALFAADWPAEQWAAWRARRAEDPRHTGFPAVPPDHGEAAAGFEARTRAARTAGVALDDQLIEPGLVAFALPVRDAAGRQSCALSVVSHTSRHSAASLRDAALPRVREAVRVMERAPAQAAAASVPGPRSATSQWARESKQELGPGFVESLARGLSVLTAFDAGRAELPLTAVAEATGLARATARRALLTLQQLGFTATDGRLFRLTPRVLDLGFAALSGLSLPDIAQPHLAGLVARVHDSASMAVLDGADVLYVARVPTVRIMSVNITLGTRFPAYATSLGRVLLAGLPAADRAAYLAGADLAPLTRHTVTDPARLAALLDQADREGHAVADEELEEGLRSLSVPVRDRAGRVVAAVNVSMHASRRTARQAREELLPPLREAVARIEGDYHAASRFTRVRPV
ncbi:IclR family transcriptional regulator C-terminal domain-containing protein [Streptomyces sp. NPDC051940]|uniref:IclR family transcriptional regulator domain-containing protein n=1 Tax=Streptomyces sp. NPDC051940 TaxID=3155675 RepID=UPI00342015D6